MKKQLIPILLAIIFVSLIGSIYLQSQKKSIITKSLPPIPTQVPTPTSPTWQSYKNNKMGFEFQYPSDWQVEATPDDLSLCQKGSSNPCVSISTNKPTVDKSSQVTDATFNGVKATKYSLKANETGAEEFVIKLLLKTPLYITYYNFGDVPQILASFKFTSSLQTYRDTQFGFEFQYPDGVYLSPELTAWQNVAEYQKYVNWQNTVKEPEDPPVDYIFSISKYKGSLSYTQKFPDTDMVFIKKLDNINPAVDLFHYIGESEQDVCVLKISAQTYITFNECNLQHLNNPTLVQIISSLKTI